MASLGGTWPPARSWAGHTMSTTPPRRLFCALADGAAHFSPSTDVLLKKRFSTFFPLCYFLWCGNASLTLNVLLSNRPEAMKKKKVPGTLVRMKFAPLNCSAPSFVERKNPSDVNSTYTCVWKVSPASRARPVLLGSVSCG